MTTTPSSPPTLADWRRLVLEAIDASNERTYSEALGSDLGSARDALLAAEDPHPPTFHVRPVWVNEFVDRFGKERRREYRECQAKSLSGVTTKQWRWGAREANGEIVIPESEPLTDRAHAIAMAKRFAAGVGGRVVDDETGEEL